MARKVKQTSQNRFNDYVTMVVRDSTLSRTSFSIEIVRIEGSHLKLLFFSIFHWFSHRFQARRGSDQLGLANADFCENPDFLS